MNNTHVDAGRMAPAVAWAAFRKVLADPDDTPRVFELIRAMAGPSLRRGLARLRDTPYGRWALNERPQLLRALRDRDALAALPAGSLGRAYFDFVYGEQLSADELVAASETDAGDGIADPELRWYRERLRDQHDLWHTLTQYGRDPFGEACLLAFTYAQGRNRGVGLLVLGGGWRLARAMGPRALAALWQGFQAGRHASWLPGQDWERLLKLPVAEVRRLLAVRPPTIYWEVSATARATGYVGQQPRNALAPPDAAATRAEASAGQAAT